MDRRTKLLLGGLAATAAGCTLGYVMYKRAYGAVDGMSLDLEEAQIEWLQEMAMKHSSGDMDRTISVLFDHCVSECADPAKADKIFIQIPRKTCDSDKKKVAIIYNITGVQCVFLRGIVLTYEISDGISKTFRIMCDYGMNDANADDIFQSVQPTTPTPSVP